MTSFEGLVPKRSEISIGLLWMNRLKEQSDHENGCQQRAFPAIAAFDG